MPVLNKNDITQLISKYLILLSLLMIGCSEQSPKFWDGYGLLNMHGPKVVDVHPDFRQFFDEFVKEGNKYRPINITSLIIQYDVGGVNAPNTLGVCYLKLGQTPKILISKRNMAHYVPGFNNMPWHGQRELIFHEMGHCVLGLRHNNQVEDNRPVSGMHSNHLGGQFYNSSTVRYYDEQLFVGFNPTFNFR